MTPLARKDNNIEITFFEDIVKDRMSATHMSKHDKESLLE